MTTMTLRISRLALGAMLLIIGACSRERLDPSLARNPDSQRLASLHAFARLYGVVRWFHPSDAAATVDWDQFAIDGARRVVDAPDASVLRMRLVELFGPVAPTMHIAGIHETFPDEPALHPSSPAALDVVAWQHKGYGDSTVATGYASKRRHRDRMVAEAGARVAVLSQSLDATPFRGTRVRLRGRMRTGEHARGQLWLRVDRSDGPTFFDNMGQRPLVSPTWASAEIVGVVGSDATRIVFGLLNESSGGVWYDDVELSVETRDRIWQSIDIMDGGFEEADPLTSWRISAGRSVSSKTIDGWNIIIDHNLPASGSSAMRIEPSMKLLSEELFDQMPAPGETFDVSLGSGLQARVPIALYARGGQTVGDDPEVARRATARRSASVPGFDPVAGTADVIVLWNVFEHFWPYWDTVAVNWTAMLDIALKASLNDRTVDDHLATLERLSAAVPDGHIGIECPGESEHGYPPFAVELVESQVVVTRSEDPAIERGDVILSVNGTPARQLLNMEEEYVSGSLQWRLIGALRRFAEGALTTGLGLRLRRSGGEHDITVSRVRRRVVEKPLYSAIEHLDDGIYYIDLSRATMADIDAVVARVADAPGVVFDLRGYPKPNSHQVLSYILTQSNSLKGWESIPLIIRPDSGTTPAAWEDTSEWNMPQVSMRQPHINGRVAFVTGSQAISYAESVMALVEHYHLGEIVGSTTAGTNGDIARIALPTGCTTSFTGRRVTRPGGGRHHGVGIRPTIPASRSIAGVQTGRDEVLEKAFAYIRSGVK